MDKGLDGSAGASPTRSAPMMNPREWLKSVEYLPDFLKDFHDAKDFFKTLHLNVTMPDYCKEHNWVSNQVFTVDVFLWYCALHGYTLQRSRKKGVAFEDLNAKLEEMRGRSMRSLAALINSVDKAPSPPSPSAEEKGKT